MFLSSDLSFSHQRSVMSANAVSCTIKSPVALQIGDAVSDSSRPGVYITDITLAEPVNVSISHISSERSQLSIDRHGFINARRTAYAAISPVLVSRFRKSLSRTTTRRIWRSVCSGERTVLRSGSLVWEITASWATHMLRTGHMTISPSTDIR